VRVWKLPVKIILLLFILQFLIPLPLVVAEEVTWVTVEGKAALADVSKTEARSSAIADASRKAVQKVVGADISAETLVVNFRLSGSLVGAIPYGRVVDSEIIEETVDSSNQDKDSQTYRVKMKAGVAEETAGADPSFRLDAYLNSASFRDGDEMWMSIRSTQDCYISVFIILEDEKIIRLIPNRFKKYNFLKAHETFLFPSENDRELGITLKVHAPEGAKAVTETLYIVGLKQDLTFDDAGFQEGIYGVYNGQTPFMRDLIKEIVPIPLNERAEKLLQYEIRETTGEKSS